MFRKISRNRRRIQKRRVFRKRRTPKTDNIKDRHAKKDGQKVKTKGKSKKKKDYRGQKKSSLDKDPD